MYLIGFYNNNGTMAQSCGGDGLMNVNNKNMHSCITAMKQFNDEVYLINNFNQKMCEMNNLYNYIHKIGKKV